MITNWIEQVKSNESKKNLSEASNSGRKLIQEN